MTDFLNTLNTLATGTEAQEGFVAHPLGEFPGTVSDVKKAESQNGNHFIAISVKTTHGTAQHTIWMPTQDSVSTAEGQKKVRGMIGRTKGILVNLGVVTAEQATSLTWSDGEQSVLSQLKNLVGKTTWVKVSQTPNHDGSRMYTNVNLNAPEANREAIVTGQPVSNNQAAAAAPAANGAIPGAIAQAAPLAAPSLDDIPF